VKRRGKKPKAGPPAYSKVDGVWVGDYPGETICLTHPGGGCSWVVWDAIKAIWAEGSAPPNPDEQKIQQVAKEVNKNFPDWLNQHFFSQQTCDNLRKAAIVGAGASASGHPIPRIVTLGVGVLTAAGCWK